MRWKYDSPRRRHAAEPAPESSPPRPSAAFNTGAAKPRPVPTDGSCLVCGQSMTLRRMRGHLLGHFEEKAGSGKSPPSACLVRITGYRPIRHWLYVRIGPRATLRSLDGLIRDTWVECCGHLSSFSSGDVSYESSPSMNDFDYGGQETATMDAGAANVISMCGPLRYEYDYGTTTELYVEMASMCPAGGMKADGVELVARNADIPYDCTECGGEGAAVCLCVNCSWEDQSTMMCASCAKRHSHAEDGDETYLLSVVNSPRMGMCAYREYWG